jgi:CheY-like chemotaxis protein
MALTVLLVEPDPRETVRLRELLEAQGQVVDVVASVAECQQALRAVRYAHVVLSVHAAPVLREAVHRALGQVEAQLSGRAHVPEVRVLQLRRAA